MGKGNLNAKPPKKKRKWAIRKNERKKKHQSDTAGRNQCDTSDSTREDATEGHDLMKSSRLQDYGMDVQIVVEKCETELEQFQEGDILQVFQPTASEQISSGHPIVHVAVTEGISYLEEDGQLHEISVAGLNENMPSMQSGKGLDNEPMEKDLPASYAACTSPENPNQTRSLLASPPSSPRPAVLRVVVDSLVERLPDSWSALLVENGVLVGRRAPGNTFVIQRSVFVEYAGQIQVTVHAKKLPSEHKFWSTLNLHPVQVDNVQDFTQNVLNVVAALRMHEICVGVNEFEDLWNTAEDADVDTNPFLEARYSKTLRTSSCELLVGSVKHKRCPQCGKLWKMLHQRNTAKSKIEERTPKKKKPHAVLTTPEINRRLHRQSKENESLQRKNERLKQKIEELVQKEGVNVPEELSDDFRKILKDEKATEGLNPFQKIFIEEQLKAATVKSPYAMRWHPLTIRVALAIQMESPQAYETISGVLRLPSQKTLYNYSHILEGQEGINHDIIRDCARQLYSSNPKDHQLFHMLAFDEMYIKKGLVYKKKTGEMVGYVKVDELKSEMIKLEAVLNKEALGEPYTPSDATPPVADKILCMMINGLTNSVKSVIACIATADMTKEDLYSIVWDVIGALELRGLRVIAVVCDGAGINRGFFQMHTPLSPTDSKIVFEVQNKFANRPIYFLNDPPHLLKTTRNGIYKSRRGKITAKNKKWITKRLKKNGQFIAWDTVITMYNQSLGNTFKKMYKLNQEDVLLNSYSMMRVPLAAHVLSRSTAHEIRIQKWKDCEELAKLCEKTNDVFDLLNGRNTFQSTRKRNDLFASYTSVDDPRFKEMQEFLDYLNGWKQEVEAAKTKLGKKKKTFDTDPSKMILSDQTLDGWERTIKGFKGAVTYVLNAGKNEEIKPFINAINLSQDPLENYFSKLRGAFGGNHHPSLQQSCQAVAKIHTTAGLSFKGRKKGNTGASRPLDFENLMQPLPKKINT